MAIPANVDWKSLPYRRAWRLVFDEYARAVVFPRSWSGRWYWLVFLAVCAFAWPLRLYYEFQDRLSATSPEGELDIAAALDAHIAPDDLRDEVVHL